MRGIYFSIALLVLYGDLLKRVMSPQMSLIVLYALAVLILIAIIRVKRLRIHMPMNREGQLTHWLVLLLVLLYFAQLLTSFSNPVMEGLTHALYMSIPLLYIVVVQRYCPQFNLVKLANVFLLLMIPINCIGLIQYFIKPDFFISTAYDIDLGGIVLRDFLEGMGTFVRYPSLFVTADRYSAMGLMQAYFTLIVFKGSNSISGRGKLWLAFNLAGAIVALLIAGARSRILIASLAFILMAITCMLGALFSRKFQRARRRIKKLFPLLAGGALIVFVALAGMAEDRQQETGSFPVLILFMQAFEEGEIGQRVEQAVRLSLVPEEVTFFGRGLGSIAGGKPGEFGIMSMWTESGLVWGSFMLFAFLGIVSVLSLKTLRSFLTAEPLNAAIYATPTLLVVTALLTGLTSSFDLSTGVLLGCSIAVIARSSANITGGFRLPLCRAGY